jgi:hypothetical protein
MLPERQSILPSKVCSRCGEPGSFCRNRTRPDGLDHICKACRKILCGAWYHVNAERVRRENLLGYRSHPEVHRACSNRWSSTHRDERRIIDNRRRARKNGVESSLTKPQWAEILEVFGYACAYCRRTDRRLTVDHLVAISRGGAHTAENVVPSCGSCNSRKKDRSIWVMAGL